VNTPPRERRQSARGRVEFRAIPAGAAYYTDANDVRWRIFDCMLVDGRFQRVYLESDAATHRVFARADGGDTLLYRRREREVYNLSPATCERQLGAARPMAAEPPFDATDAEGVGE
jgi:hypothetical protein